MHLIFPNGFVIPVSGSLIFLAREIVPCVEVGDQGVRSWASTWTICNLVGPTRRRGASKLMDIAPGEDSSYQLNLIGGCPFRPVCLRVIAVRPMIVVIPQLICFISMKTEIPHDYGAPGNADAGASQDRPVGR